jgi:hypothetical protein
MVLCLRWRSRPSAAALQEEAANCRKLRRGKRRGGERCGKGGLPVRQVWTTKASESKPSMTCRNRVDDIRTGLRAYGPGGAWGIPVYCPGGVRHGGGASVVRAQTRNVGTRRPDTGPAVHMGSQAPRPARARPPSGGHRKGQSSDAGHGGGPSHTSVEGPVMGLEQRRRVTHGLV